MADPMLPFPPAAGNMVFLPPGAAMIDMVPQNNEDKQPWVHHMAQDFAAMGYRALSLPPQRSYLMLQRVGHSPEFQSLTPAQRLEVIHRGTCPKKEVGAGLGGSQRDACRETSALRCYVDQWLSCDGIQ